MARGLSCQLQAAIQLKLQGIYAGNYEARVTAISAFDIASLPTYSILTTLSGKQGLPPALANITATGILFGYRLNCEFPCRLVRSILLIRKLRLQPQQTVPDAAPTSAFRIPNKQPRNSRNAAKFNSIFPRTID